MIGMIAGTVDNRSTLLVLAYAQLLRRPDAAAHARVAALAGDSATVRRYIFEAARFDPPMPVLPRVALRTTKLAEGTSRERLIPAGTLLLLGNISALHDPDGFDQPGTFDIDHDAGRLLFGAGFHRCLGYEINGIVIPQLAAALLRLKKSRFAPGADGRVQFNGMLANRLMLDFA
jgi:cytochrome P450